MALPFLHLKSLMRSAFRNGGSVLDGVSRDLLFAARRLRRAPGFLVVAVASLGMGVGVTAVAFSLLSSVSFRPLPFPEPDRLMDVYEHHPVQVCAGCGVGTSYPNFLDWRAQSISFAAMAAYRTEDLVWTGQEAPARVQGVASTPELFRLLGARFVTGRPPLPADDRPGAAPVVVLGETFWRERMGARPDALGSSLTLNGVPHTVVGVLTDGLTFPTAAAVWLPLGPRVAGEARDDRSVSVVARLADGSDLPEAAAEIALIGRRLAAAYPEQDGGWSAHVVPLHADLASDYAPSFRMLLGAVCFVLLVACANLAGLLLVRGAERETELAVRSSLGASRCALVRALLGEAVVVGVLGGAAGLLVAWWGVDVARALLGGNLPAWVTLSLDSRVVAFTAAVTLLTILVFGLLPAVRSSRTDVAGVIREGSGWATEGPGKGRARRVLVVAEVACALVLLTGTGLLLRSTIAASTVDLGYDTAPLLAATVEIFGSGSGAPAAAPGLQRALREAALAVPGASSAALSNLFILEWPGGPTRGVEAEGVDRALAERVLRRAVLASPGYFETLGIPLVRGRAFTDRDDPAGPPVVVLGASAAGALWPGEDPLGRRIRIGAGDPASPWRTVVGVAADVRTSPLARGIPTVVYLPYLQQPTTSPAGMLTTVHVRAAGEPGALVAPLRAALGGVRPDVVVARVATADEELRLWIWPLWLTTRFAGALALFAAILALTGVYGVVSSEVRRRRRDLGIRVALGASRRRILGEVLRSGAALVGTGIVVGCLAAAGLTRVMGSVVVDLGRLDPWVVAAAAVLFGGVGVLASWLPARVAASTDPAEALRGT